MYRIDRAVSEWQRVYTQLCAAQDCLRRGAAATTDATGASEELLAQLHRLQEQEERALHAINEALSAVNAGALEKAARARGTPAADPPTQ